MATDTQPQPEPEPTPILLAQRTGTLAWTGHNARGAQVLIGKEGTPGVFSPGELLAIALAACTGMSAESRITSELGEEVELSVGVERVHEPHENRYARLLVELVAGGPAVENQDARRRERMLAAATQAAERYCTVGRTLTAGAEVAVITTAESH